MRLAQPRVSLAHARVPSGPRVLGSSGLGSLGSPGLLGSLGSKILGSLGSFGSSGLGLLGSLGSPGDIGDAPVLFTSGPSGPARVFFLTTLKCSLFSRPTVRGPAPDTHFGSRPKPGAENYLTLHHCSTRHMRVSAYSAWPMRKKRYSQGIRGETRRVRHITANSRMTR